jgi:hypothetical protein
MRHGLTCRRVVQDGGGPKAVVLADTSVGHHVIARDRTEIGIDGPLVRLPSSRLAHDLTGILCDIVVAPSISPNPFDVLGAQYTESAEAFQEDDVMTNGKIPRYSTLTRRQHGHSAKRS